MKSRNIQNLTFPCELRDELDVASVSHSEGDEATEAETLCQKSDVAICLALASEVQVSQEKVGGSSSNEPRKEQVPAKVVRLTLKV